MEQIQILTTFKRLYVKYLILNEHSLYFLDIPDGKSQLVDTGMVKSASDTEML